MNISSVSNKRPYASRPPPTSPLHFRECTSEGSKWHHLPSHVHTPWLLSSSPPWVCLLFFFLSLFNTRITKKDPPPVTSLVWYFKHDKMFLVDLLISLCLITWWNFLTFCGKEKALLSRSWSGPTERFILGEGWLRLGGPCLEERILFQDRTPEGWIILGVLPL